MTRNNVNTLNDTYLKNLLDVNGVLSILKSTNNLEFKTVLDIGFGKGGASLFFADMGKEVTALGYDLKSYDYPKEKFDEYSINTLEGLFEDLDENLKYDAIFISHTLEHTRNPGAVLDKCRKHLNPEGWLFIIVPPYKENLVGGHITNGWNLGQLMYNLLLADFNIKDGHFVSHGYNVCAFVKANREHCEVLDSLRYDNGDLEFTKELWPTAISQGINGCIKEINWFKDSFDINFPKPLSVENIELKDTIENLNSAIVKNQKEKHILETECKQAIEIEKNKLINYKKRLKNHKLLKLLSFFKIIKL